MKKSANKTVLIMMFLLILPLTIDAQKSGKAENISKSKGSSWINYIPSDDLIKWRRHIHQNPELSFKEVNTSAYVEGILNADGNIEVLRPSPTSVIGILKGKKPGKTVALRADMDALPIQEETGLQFASMVPGVSHACGHDLHTSILLGTAATLSQMQDQLAGTVYFIFQHAEEHEPGGASEIINSGMLNGVDAFFGMHVIPNIPAGDIGILPAGIASSAIDVFYLTIQGKGTHGSKPHLGIDPILTGAEIVTALETIVSHNVTPGDMAVLSVGKFQAGEAPNVIPDKAFLSGTVRTVNESTRKLMAERTKTIIDNITKANGAEYKLDYIFNYPSIQNDPVLREVARKSAVKILGEDHVFDEPRMTGSEDFSKYGEIAPVFYMVLGAGPGPSNHNPGFNPNENAMINGVKAEVQLVIDFLQNTK